MPNSAAPSTPSSPPAQLLPSTPPNNRLLYLVLAVIAFIGFADATYLAAEHFLGAVPPCTIVSGCETVTTSSFSVFYGVPVALFGSIFYLTVILLALISIHHRPPWLQRTLPALGVLGFLATARFVYLQLVVIKAICLYCMVSAMTSTGVLLVSGILYWRNSKAK